MQLVTLSIFIFHCFIAATEVHTDEMINTNVGEEEQVFVQIPYDTEEGQTIKMNVTSGTVRIYVSDLIATPNEAFYEWTGETNGCLDIFLDPDQLNRTVGVSVHVVIQGVDTHNEFLFISENGNTGKFYSISLLSYIMLICVQCFCHQL